MPINMKGINPILLLLFYYLFLSLGGSKSSADTIQAGNGGNGVYIVYMGAADSTNASLRNDHAHVLNTVLRRYIYNCIYIVQTSIILIYVTYINCTCMFMKCTIYMGDVKNLCEGMGRL